MRFYRGEIVVFKENNPDYLVPVGSPALVVKNCSDNDTVVNIDWIDNDFYSHGQENGNYNVNLFVSLEELV
tara:strand:- start:114 stop:326 length:213 start_codon:yes stop_codon:yes gene_type:complete